MNGTIFDIKEMAVHDGPGIRTTVFLKGCPLRCRWCHNPEGLSSNIQLMYKSANCIKCRQCRIKCDHKECEPFGLCLHVCPQNCLELSGRTVDSKVLAEELKCSAQVLGTAFGGFTFSGGEPLAQPQFLLSLIEELKDYHLCIETSGYADKDAFKSINDRLDYVIMDIKIADADKHFEYTGVRNDMILENFEQLKNSGKEYLIRTPMIKGITDTEENLSAIREIIGDSKWEKIPYNELAGAKYKMLNMEFDL